MIPMIDGTYDGMEWGEADRTADHATVAMNAERDILVAFHSTRADIEDSVGTHQGFHEPLKQVELAFFRYDSQDDEWDLTAQKLIGSTVHDPRFSNEQEYVRCERPDVIAAGSRFFVVWTRRYDRDQPGDEEEPAVLECAWVEWNSSTSTLDIHNGGLADGLGYPLDTDYWVRECAGVPDAVLFDVDSTSSTVGVVYPHQTDFGDALDGNDNERRCELRLIVTSLTHSSHTIPTPDAPYALVDDINFDGPTAPSGEVAAGLILPDLARAQPDSVTGAFRFWLAYEEQNFPLTGTVPDGRIRLGLIEQTATGWGPLGTHTFGLASAPYARRRPNLASHPEDAGGLDVVSIAFSKTNTTGNDDVVHQEWLFDADDGLTQVITQPVHAFENTTDHHTRPVPLHGRTTPLVRRLYIVNSTDKELLEYDVDSDDTTVRRTTTENLGRPAVAYRAGSGSVPDDVALTWEETGEAAEYARIWLRVD